MAVSVAPAPAIVNSIHHATGKALVWGRPFRRGIVYMSAGRLLARSAATYRLLARSAARTRTTNMRGTIHDTSS